MVDLEVPGTKSKNTQRLREDMHKTLRAHCTDLSDLSNLNAFPGSQPVSLAREKLAELHTCVVCEKSDGVRYFLYVPQLRENQQAGEIVEANAYMVDRRYDFWEVKVLLPKRVVTSGVTILDGELVVDYDTEIRFLIYDTLLLGGSNFMNNPYLERLNATLLHGIMPIRLQKVRNPACIPLFIKDFFEITDLRFLSEEVIPKLPHTNDGLIFTQTQAPYVFGTSATILKWKPDHLNTVDFALKADATEGIKMHTSSRDGLELFDASLALTEEEETSVRRLISEAEGKPLIVECAYDHEAMKWKIHKTRTDKDKANFTGVVANIWRTIKERITLAELIALCESAPGAPHKRQKTE